MKIDWQTVTRLTEYDWLFNSFFLVMIVAVTIAAILRADNGETLGRARYFLRMLTLVLAAYVVTALVSTDPFRIAGRLYFVVNLDFIVTDFSLFTLWKVCVVITFYVQTRWTVCRIREIGRFSIWWALLVALPTVGVIPALVFSLIPPGAPRRRQPESFSSGQEAPVPLLRAG